METTIYLIRHAEAEGNLYRRIHGQYDSNVTENGLRQIAALEKRFRDVHLDAVYSSDLNRTVRTARALAEPKGLAIQTDPRFREVCIGVWEDVPFGELNLTDAKQMKNFNYDPPKWRVEGAERYPDYTTRFIEALREVAEKHGGETVAVFAHGCVLSQTLGILFPDREICHMDNTAVTRIRWDGSFHLEIIGDNSHLSEEISTLAKQNWWRGKDAAPDRNLWFMPYESEIDWYLRLCDDSVPVAPMAVIDFAMLEQDAVGLVQLDPQRDQEEKAGFVDYIGLQKKLRGQRLGIQLLGAAVSYYRGLNREKLRVCLSGKFASYREWFLHYGFEPAGNDCYDLDIRVPNGK